MHRCLRLNAKQTVALVAVLLLLRAAALAQGAKACMVTSDAPVISPFKSEEYEALMRAGMEDRAAKYVICVAPKGSKVLITDVGAHYVSAHVETGPQKGCDGNLARDYYSCKH